MIHPSEIRRKAENLYPAFLQAWLDRVSFFPKHVPANLQLPAEAPEAIAAINALRDGSKDVRGFGYHIEWEERRLRLLGQNRVPRQITLETPEDFLRLIGRESHFQAFAETASRLRRELPELENWLRSHQTRLAELATGLDGLVEVAQYIRQHPRPNCFVRELPLGVDTKFIERHERVLGEWFDIILPPHTIRADESHFERRFGFRYAEPHVFVRLLDAALQNELGVPFSEFSLPVAILNGLPIGNVRTLIVENKVNLLTLPPLPRTIALGGLGTSVTMFRDIDWLQHAPIDYWGDIDTAGFMILSSLRAIFPQVRSYLMEEGLLDKFPKLVVPDTSRVAEVPRHLTEQEACTFHRCQSEALRLEQERIPQSELVELLTRICR